VEVSGTERIGMKERNTIDIMFMVLISLLLLGALDARNRKEKLEGSR
jgi:hypothetical protein